MVADSAVTDFNEVQEEKHWPTMFRTPFIVTDFRPVQALKHLVGRVMIVFGRTMDVRFALFAKLLARVSTVYDFPS